MVSASFAFTFPTYYVYNGQNYKLNSVNTYYNQRVCTNDSVPLGLFYNPAGSQIYASYTEVDSTICLELDRAGYGHRDSGTVYYPDNSCVSPNTIVNGECVAPETCDPLAGQYTSSSTGQCVDCMGFSNFSGRASCACDSMGSTYSAQSVTIELIQQFGQYNYKKSYAKCDNGNNIAVYYDPTPITPTDNNTTTPTDNNTTTPPSDTNTTTDGNTTTPLQSDVVNAVKDSSDKTIKAINETNTAIKSVDTSVQAVNTTLQSSNTKLDSMVSKLSDSNALLSDSKNIQSDVKNILSSEFKQTSAFREHLDARFKNLIDVSLANGSQLNDISAHAASTANAVNAQGDKIAGKLDDILNAIKDGNGTDMTATNDLLEKINKDTNSTASGVDTLHDDLNTSIELLNNISTAFENNNSFRVPDVNESKFELSDLLPENNWFETNKLNLNFKNYGGGCYCQTAEFRVAGRTFVFPPQEALDVIPFDVISKIFMAFIYVLGLRDFLRN